MAEKTPSKQQIFKQVKQLCLQRNFKASRYLICKASGLEIKDPMQISRNQIRQMTQDKLIHQMLDIEDACVSVYHTFRQENPNEHLARQTAQKLKKAIPLLSRNEKLTAFYWLNNCYSYIPEASDEERLDAIQNIIALAPEKAHDNLLFSCANQIIDLDITAQDKYRTIKQAYKKTDKKSHTIPHLKDLLSKSGQKYLFVLQNRLNNPQIDYNERQNAGYEAIQVSNDVKASVSKKCYWKLDILKQLYNLQCQHQDKDGMKKSGILLCKYAQQLENIKSLMGTNRAQKDWYR